MTTDASRTTERFCATYFRHQNNFEKWLQSNLTHFELNAYNETNHEQILQRWPGSKTLYENNKKGMLKSLQKYREMTELDQLDLYRLLCWATSVQRQKRVQKGTFEPMVAPIEGNNRTGAHTYMLLGTTHDAKNDSMTCGTLSTQWIVENIEQESISRQSIRDQYQDLNLHELTKQQIVSNDSGLNKVLAENMTMVWGKSKT